MASACACCHRSCPSHPRTYAAPQKMVPTLAMPSSTYSTLLPSPSQVQRCGLPLQAPARRPAPHVPLFLFSSPVGPPGPSKIFSPFSGPRFLVVKRHMRGSIFRGHVACFQERPLPGRPCCQNGPPRGQLSHRIYIHAHSPTFYSLSMLSPNRSPPSASLVHMDSSTHLWPSNSDSDCTSHNPPVQSQDSLPQESLSAVRLAQGSLSQEALATLPLAQNPLGPDPWPLQPPPVIPSEGPSGGSYHRRVFPLGSLLSSVGATMASVACFLLRDTPAPRGIPPLHSRRASAGCWPIGHLCCRAARLASSLALLLLATLSSVVLPRTAHALTAEVTIGTAASHVAASTGLRPWLLYKLDLLFASNPSFKILALAAVCAVVTVVGAVAYAVHDNHPLGDSLWASWSLLIDTGALKDQDTAPKRRVSVILSVCGVLFLATLLGIVVDAAGGRLESLRKGRTRVFEQGHTLILGWNAKTLPLVRQLMSAYVKAKDKERHPVVVMGEVDKETMDEGLRSAFSAEERKKFRIIARKGSPFSEKDLTRCSAQAARSIIVLAPEGVADPQAADEHVIHAALGVAYRPDINADIIADLSKESSALMLKTLYSSLLSQPQAPRGHTAAQPTATAAAAADAAAEEGKRMVPVATGDAALRALVISAVNPRCASVWMELLTFDGNEFHFRHWKELAGQKFGDAVFAFDDAILCGILRKESEGASTAPGPYASKTKTEPKANTKLLYCPSPETVIQEGDNLLFIAEDRNSFRPGPSRKPPVSAAVQNVGAGEKPPSSKGSASKAKSSLQTTKKILISWWRPDAKAMLELLGAFLEPGSSVTIMDGEGISAAERRDIRHTAKKCKLALDFLECSSSIANAEQLSTVPLETYDTVIVLRPTATAPVPKVEGESLEEGGQGSETMEESATTTAMLIRHMQVSRGRKDAEVVAEVTFQESSEPALQALRDASGVSWAMVPEAVQAQVLAQLSENADVGKLIDSLVSKHLGSLEPRSILRYANAGETLSFWELQERALRKHGEVIIAWERGTSGAPWVVNPANKQQQLPWAEGDQVMVIKSGQEDSLI